MVGKGSLLVILGFSILFGVASKYWNRTSTRAVENFVHYHNETVAHNVAVAGANVAANKIFLDTSATNFTQSASFSGGTYSIIASPVGSNRVHVYVIGQYSGIVDTAELLLQKPAFTKFAYYSVVEPAVYWITGDTMWGPYHSQSKLYLSGSPVFFGKVSTRLGTNPTLPNPNATPHFYGGYQSGVSIQMPTDLTPLQQAASDHGRVFTNPSRSGNYDVYLTFNPDGKVTFKDNTMSSDSTVDLSILAPNGVIWINKGTAHVQGTLDGRATVLATGSSGVNSNFGNVLIENDVKYKDDPRIGPSNDMLGLVAQNNVTISSDFPNTDITIQAGIFSATGSFSYAAYNSKLKGTLYLYGSIANYQRGAVGQFDRSTNTKTSGFTKNYKYDDRFYGSSPPSFPNTGTFEILTWRE